MDSLIKKKKILLVEHTWPEFFNSRVALGKHLIKNGYEVYALLPEDDLSTKYKSRIEKSGLHVITYKYERNSIGIFSNIAYVNAFYKVFKEHKFDLIHSFKFQPNFYTTLASIFYRKAKIVLHITGLGIVFINSNSVKNIILRTVSKLLFLFNYIFADKLIFQNYQDEKDLWLSNAFQKKLTVIEGSGVDMKKFDKSIYDLKSLRESFDLSGKLVLTFISRLVWAKGVKEVIEAVNNLVSKYPNLLLQIVGSVDVNNPNGVPQSFVDSYDDHPTIKFLGYRSDTPELLASSDIYVYPSYYREGVPRTVLEALSTGIPIITSDMPGCRLTVKDKFNGILVEPRSTESLTIAIDQLLSSQDLKEKGLNSRTLASERFDNSLVFDKILKEYQELID